MEIAALESQPELDSIMQAAERYGIETNLLDLITYGFTVIPPEKVAPVEFTDRLRTALLDLSERIGNHIEDWRTFDGPLEYRFANSGLLMEDEVFIEMIHNPVMQFVAQFMMGKSAFVGATFGNIKTCQQGSGKGLHADQFNIQSPWPTYDHYANLSWLLSDYNGLEDGPTVLIPGSHLRSTQPHPASGKDMEEIQLLLDQDKSEHTKPVAITGPAGSLACWTGSTWHAAPPKYTPGLRLMITSFWMRQHVRAWHRYDNIDPALLQRWPDLLRLIGEVRSVETQPGMTQYA